MDKDIERWKRDREALDRIASELYTMLDSYEDSLVGEPMIVADMRTAASRAASVADYLSVRIKSRETLKAQLQDSLSQATDGGK